MERNIEEKNPDDVQIMDATVSAFKRKTGFQIGHPRFAGRKPGSMNKRTRLAIEICEELNFHPAAFLATIAMTGLMPNPSGPPTPVSTEERLKAVTALAPFVMPRLQATQTQITGPQGGPIETVDLTALMADPKLLEKAQDLALGMLGPGSQDRGPDVSPDQFEKDGNGHYKA